MKPFKALASVFCLALFSAFLAPGALADAWNRETIVKFSGPVEIPGVHVKGWGVLPAGTYVFKILGSQANRHIVQIFSEDKKTVYATILAIPNYRLKVTDKTVITFAERPAGQPEAIRAWFYPGRQWGEEFVYPKEKAEELAKAANARVLFASTEIPYEVEESRHLGEEPLVEELNRVPVRAMEPTGSDVELAQVVEFPPAEEFENEPEVAQNTEQQTVAQNREQPYPTQNREQPTIAQNTEQPREVSARDDRETSLPDTASSLPLIGLVGLLALGAALYLRRLRTPRATRF